MPRSLLRRLALCVLLVAAAGQPAGTQTSPATPSPSRTYRYHPKFRVPPSLEAVQQHFTPGLDAFPEEKVVAELAIPLRELSSALRLPAAPRSTAINRVLAPAFKGSRLTPSEETSVGGDSQLEIVRSRSMTAQPSFDGAAFQREVAAFLTGFDAVETAELLVTAIELPGEQSAPVRTTIRYDLVGTSGAGRAERLGHWQLQWQRGPDNTWRIAGWTSLDDLRSRATAPIFSEATGEAFGGLPSFREQLVPGLDYWAAHLDGVFTPRGMGHHGVSVGDIDGDGLDDVYVSQPDGLPNRLFRNKGDGTFEDVTEAAGLAVLDRTSQAIFADTDNDGDQDLVLLSRIGPMLFVNDGRGVFTRDADAFRFERPLQGSLTSAAMADYDRDGFLDLYLCAYGYFIGVSEDKAGPPNPYHDALNGSPNVLLRNDGHGRFVDVTDTVGLNQNNDRFSFAPAWGDYDGDGWPDLLVSNDFGRKNLYHLSAAGSSRRFEDVAAAAGVEDYGAGMSAAFLDYDNDGRLDVYTGNMWTAAGQRITAAPGFKPDASPEVREIYRRHTRGNSLFHNRGDGTFEDVTLAAHAEFGRWAWSSDALDFDNDGWEDLYVVNGMFTRSDGEPAMDVDSFFWRQVVAQSPLTRTPGTKYDDGWRATNRLLVADGAQAQHERNVLLRNNGRGGFDEISGTAGLDVDQDGRAFAVFDYDGDGDADVLLMAPRSSPQLRLFRNDFGSAHPSVVLHLIGTKSNRDAVGARVTIETDQGRLMRMVKAGSGFVSQGTKDLLFGLGSAARIVKVTINWPSGLVQTLTNVPLNHRVLVQEGRDELDVQPFRRATQNAGAAPSPVGQGFSPAALPGPATQPSPATRPSSAPQSSNPAMQRGTWLYEPFPAPDFTLTDLSGQQRSLSGLAGRPALLLFWATWAPPSTSALAELSAQAGALSRAGIPALALSVDAPEDEAKVRAAAGSSGVPMVVAGEAVAGAYTMLHRYVYDRREDLPLPIVFLLNAKGDVVKVYRDAIAAAQVLEDAPRIEVSEPDRLARAVPFAGTFYGRIGDRAYFQYGLELSEQDFDAPALAVFERVAAKDPSAITFHNLGTLYMKGGRSADARAAFEHALALKADYADANNSLGALLAQSGDVTGAIGRFRAAIASKPDFPDALNNLGFALFQLGQVADALALYEKALALQPDFPEALNNMGIYYGRQRDLDQALTYFRRAVEKRGSYGEAANNLALVLAARGDMDGAIAALQALLGQNPGFEMAYVTLSRIYLKAGRREEGLQTLERLLQRNPTSPLGLEMLRQVRGGG